MVFYLRFKITPSQQAWVASSYVRYHPLASPQQPLTDDRYGLALCGSPPGGPQHESGLTRFSEFGKMI